MSIILGLFLILYLILAIKRIDWALMLIIFFLPLYVVRFDIVIPTTLLELIILICFVVWFLGHTKFVDFLKRKYTWKQFKEEKKKRMKYPFSVEISLLLIISYIAVGFSGFSNPALGIWKAYFFEPVLVFILILNIFNPTPTLPLVRGGKNENSPSLPRRGAGGGLKKILWPLSLSALLVSLFAVYQKFTGDFISNPLWAAEDTRRVTSIFSYPNAVGLFLGPLVLVFEGWLVSIIKNSTPNTEKKQLLKIGYISLVIILSVLAIFFAKSEGALIGVIAGLVIFGLFFGKKVRAITLIVIILATLFVGFYPPARDYTKKKITLSDLSGEIRKQQWRETFEMLKGGKFFMGTGLNNYQASILPYHQEGIFFNSDNLPWEEFRRKIVFNEEANKKYWQPVEIYMYPHNILLNFWTELGLAGAFLFVWIIARYFIMGLKNLKQEKKFLPLGLIGAMVAIVVHGLVDVPYFKNDLAVMFWVLVALLSIINIINREDKTII